MTEQPKGAGGERKRDDDVELTETVPTHQESGRSGTKDDVESDPARDDRLGSDWSDEGGATPAGPATSTPGGVENEESKRQIRIDREREEHEGGGDDADSGTASGGTGAEPVD